MKAIKKDLSQFWPTIINSSPNGVLVVDDQGEILFYNTTAKVIFGRPIKKEDMVGRNIAEFRPEIWLDLNEVIKKGKPQLKKKITLADITIIANHSPIKTDGKIFGALLVFQDISEYETIISELKGYNSLYKELEAIFESSFDGLYITDGNANTIRVNSAYEKITGLSKNDLIGQNMHNLVKEKVFDSSVTLEVLEKKKSITIMQKVLGEKQLIVTGTPVFDEKGEILLVVTNVRDITGLNNLRSQLEESRRINSSIYQTLQEHDGTEHALEKLVIKSQSMVQVIKKAIKVARAETSILLLGESGVGKSMIADIIHKMSPRKEGPFIKINCGAIPYSLMESELFGYEKGAFTGALHTGKAGLIEIANQGTVFLDEVGELKPDMQVKLLEVLENKTFKKIGSQRSTEVDVNIIAATNRDLKTMIKDGSFREDLYYRLNVVPISIPPLRKRKEDILPLAINVLEKFNKQKKLKKKLMPEILDRLGKYNFPGNVRELVNIVERMVILSDSDQIVVEDLPASIKEKQKIIHGLPVLKGSLKGMLADVEARIIKEALSRYDTILEVSKALKLHPTTLWRKMVKYGIR